MRHQTMTSEKQRMERMLRERAYTIYELIDMIEGKKPIDTNYINAIKTTVSREVE